MNVRDIEFCILRGKTVDALGANLPSLMHLMQIKCTEMIHLKVSLCTLIKT